MRTISSDRVVATWFMRGLESYFAAFCIPSYQPRYRFKSFLYIVGLELITKSYLLAKHAEVYNKMELDRGKEAVNTMMKSRKYHHHLTDMAKEIREDSQDKEFASLLDSRFMASVDNGNGILKIMKAGFFECRYPVPHEISESYPVDGVKDAYWLPLESTDIQNFAFVYAREIQRLLLKKYDIPIPANHYKNVFSGELGDRFSRLFMSKKSWSYFGKENDIDKYFEELFSRPPTESAGKS